MIVILWMKILLHFKSIKIFFTGHKFPSATRKKDLLHTRFICIYHNIYSTDTIYIYCTHTFSFHSSSLMCCSSISKNKDRTHKNFSLKLLSSYPCRQKAKRGFYQKPCFDLRTLAEPCRITVTYDVLLN